MTWWVLGGESGMCESCSGDDGEGWGHRRGPSSWDWDRDRLEASGVICGDALRAGRVVGVELRQA